MSEDIPPPPCGTCGRIPVSLSLHTNEVYAYEIRQLQAQVLRLRELYSPLKELESLCITLIRALERGDEYDKEMDLVRSWVCDRYPDVAGGGSDS